MGLLIGVIGLVVAAAFRNPLDPSDTRWQTMLFTTLAFLQIGQALGSRSTEASIFATGLRGNPTLLGLAGLTLLLQLGAIYLPFLEDFFQVTPLTILDLAICLVLGSTALIGIEIEKRFLQRRRPGNVI